VGLTALTGTEFRRALGLRSTNFEMAFSGRTVIFKTIGYGHGVGMSQTDAELKIPAGVAV